ncbi:MAG: SH3 domain-containing protein [Chloroflexi bacterium]|nr:SH3 domain-containing protein [Chloroflexota bacterium]
MTTWCFRLLAVPLLVGVLSIAMMRPEVASAQTPPASTQNYGAIAKTALPMLHQQRGQCFPWVRAVVQSALGRVMGNDYHHGYLQAGGIEVPLVNARHGDIIQVTNPANTAWDADYPGLHTAIVLDNLGNGKFRVIDSNSEYDGVVRVRDNYNPAELSTRQPGLVVRVYRIEGAPGVVTPVVPPTPTFATTGTLPAPGARVTVAADGDCLRVRSAPGLGGGVLGCMPTGQQVTVTQSGPSAEGYRWVQINSGALSGWAAADYLSAGVLPIVSGAGSTPIASTPVLSSAPAPASVIEAPPPPIVVASRKGFVVPPVYGRESQQASAVFYAGSVDDLIAAATEAKASGVWAQDRTGEFQLLIVGGPTFMVDAFRTKVVGFSGPTALTLIGTVS